VLLVAGSPTWEYRMVQVLLSREKTIDLSCWLQSIKDMPQEGTVKIESLPLSREDLAKYDVVLLFDPDPSDFLDPQGGATRWGETIKQFLSDGGGVLYMAGPKYAGQFLTDHRTDGIADVLPVKFPEQKDMLIDYLGDKYNKPFPLRVVSANVVDHAVMKFDGGAEKTLQRWETMPPMYWSFPALGKKPVGRVLLEHSDPSYRRDDNYRPLLVTGQYGPGRTVYMGFNGTWRWRRLGRDGEYFTRFWVQTVDYLIEGRLVGSQKRGRIEIPRERFDVGERVAVSARLKNAQGEPLTEPTVAAALHLHGEKTPLSQFTLTASKEKDRAGEYDGEVEVRKEGRYVATIQLPGAKPGETITLTSRYFLVAISNAELENRQLNKSLLIDLAKKSRHPDQDPPKQTGPQPPGQGDNAPGKGDDTPGQDDDTKGGYYEVNQFDQLIKAIPDRTLVRAVPGRPVELWDTSRLVFLLALLLTIEWGTRKRFKLM
jgi:uncharacterized membrane protein